MGFTNIKAKNQGFTIVELLIVVVVIAILAAITIVSYNGITNRANASAAKSTAATWQKKIELYQSEVGNYPFTPDLLAGDSTKSYHIPRASLATSLDSTTGKSKVIVTPCSANGTTTSASNMTGVRIQFWDYEASPTALTTSPVIVGTCATNAAYGSAWTAS